MDIQGLLNDFQGVSGSFRDLREFQGLLKDFQSVSVSFREF